MMMMMMMTIQPPQRVVYMITAASIAGEAGCSTQASTAYQK